MAGPGVTEELLGAGGIRDRVDGCLEDFLVAKSRAALAQGLPTEIPRVLRGFLGAGGKRIRPLLCVVGWLAGGGTGVVPQAVVRVAASLELFHAFALIHDDVMDDSDTRRGAPTVHRAQAARRTAAGGTGSEAERFGLGAAILAGDAALAWSDGLLHTAGLPPERLMRVLPLVDAMRTEVVHGQFADLEATGSPGGDVEAALAVVRYKTATYTIERPLHVGAALAAAGEGVLEVLSGYALPVGEAFQLRDDLLGVFGSGERTGKSRLDDLRAGKHTVLVAQAFRYADPGQRQVLLALLGRAGLDEGDAETLRGVLLATGARERVEDMIRERRARALDALRAAGLPPAAAAVLRRLAGTATVRPS